MSRRSFLVLWWMAQTPHAAMFDNKVAAEAAANVRNALLVTMTTKGMVGVDVEDWYRRNDEGQPMPAEWRDLLGQVRVHHYLPGGVSE